MKTKLNKPVINMIALLMLGYLSSACSPRITIDPPKEPIMINMNVKIEHEIRIKVEKELNELLTNNPALF